MKIITNIILIYTLLFTLGCGFKVVEKADSNNFKIKEISTNGNNRINYRIKNYILANTQENNENILSLDINTKLNKKIKEKNIKNEITKYEITLKTSVNTYLIEKNIRGNFDVTVFGDYLVDSNYSGTINNEKNLINNLTDQLSKNILKKLKAKINDI
tara:strand:- start:70 stop:543 length:474 start_codon:yes stop_codon:yes gene_type:complete